MKKRIYIALMMSLITLTGCDPSSTESGAFSTQKQDNATEDKASKDDAVTTENEAKNTDDTSVANENNNTEEITDTAENAESEEAEDSLPEPVEYDDGIVFSDDFSYDYGDVIKEAVNKLPENSSGLQEELDRVYAIERHFDEICKKAVTQADMNMTSYWTYSIWDAEINSLWSRISNTFSDSEKEVLLDEQRNWISMKDEMVLESLGPREQGGSIYPLLENELLKDITETRCYKLASALAEKTGESIKLPELGITGRYVDSQGTGEVYSSLIISRGYESDYECELSVYRLGGAKGSVEKEGDYLIFESLDDSMKGKITYGWDGATFEVTEVTGSTPFSEGDVFEFPIVY